MFIYIFCWILATYIVEEFDQTVICLSSTKDSQSVIYKAKYNRQLIGMIYACADQERKG